MDRLDLVIRGGTIADGSGGALWEGDVGVADGKIVALGKVAAKGREELDAKGMLVTPGFIDIHTHYDGQLTWSDKLDPSSDHGVTTVVAGNCGVGFAPCRRDARENLIRLMEGVEDIPELVMAEGLPWDWESFPDYLDSIARRPHNIDFAILLPHAPMRVFAMGERALNLEPATEADRAVMRELARQAVSAGALGFSTSRAMTHRASDGSYIPTLRAEREELTEIAKGLADAGRGILQAITVTDTQKLEDFELFHSIAMESGRPLSYPITIRDRDKDLWRRVLAAVERDNAAGADLTVQILNRPVGVIMGLETTLHPFSMHPFYQEHLAGLSLADRVARMRHPEIRAVVTQPAGKLDHPFATTVRRFEQMYPMGSIANYEPDRATSVTARAAALGLTPDEVAYDLMLEQDGHAKLMVAATNFSQGHLDETLEMMKHENTVLGLGDGGAHCGLVSDFSYSTFTLTHWARDRKRDGRLNLPQAVQMLTEAPARMARFNDRGRIAAGFKADLNVIDMDRLQLFSPDVAYDLPGGGRRLTQRADGYVATFVSGTAVQREGKDTGARPGSLVRNAGI